MNKPVESPSHVRHAMQSAAACDAVVTAEDCLRAFRYEVHREDGTIMAMYDNGAGDHALLFFTPDGRVIIKGFDHESDVSPHARDIWGVWPGLYDGVPADLMALLENEETDHEEVTFCYWSVDGETWSTGNANIPADMDDGSAWLLGMVRMDAEAFIEWGRDYYGERFDRLGHEGVRQAYKNSGAD